MAVSGVINAQKQTITHEDSLREIVKKAANNKEKIMKLDDLATYLLGQNKLSSADSFTKEELKLSEKLGDNWGIMCACTKLGILNEYQGKYSLALQNFFRGLVLIKDRHDKKSEVIIYSDIGDVYNMEGNYTSAMQSYMASQKVNKDLGDKDRSGILYSEIAGVYFGQENFSEALKNEQKASDIAKEVNDSELLIRTYGDIGDIYMKMGKYTEALAIDLQNIDRVQKMGDIGELADIYNNIGNIYLQQRKYDEALKNIKKGLEINKEIPFEDGIAQAYTGMGKILLIQKRYPKAKLYLDSALNILEQTGDKLLLSDIYKNYAVLDSSMGNFIIAYSDFKKYTVLHDSIINQKSIAKITQLQDSRGFEQTMDSIKMEQEKANIIKAAVENKRKIVTNSLIIILLLTLLSAVILASRQRLKRKKDKIILENEKWHIEEKLNNSKIILEEYIRNIVEKNTLIDQFRLEVEELKKLKAKEIDNNRIEHIEYLNKTIILTDDDWNHFKKLFEQVYKGFFVRLKEKFPDLTQAEVRLICLTKLKLETKQMADILGVSANTIKVTRHRLRKKVGLEERDSLSDIVESI